MLKHVQRYAFGLLLAANAGLLASEHVAGQEKPSGSTLRTTTRAVVVNVVVIDRQGKPVTDLASRDFTIFDNGHLQTVAPISEAAGEQVTPSSSVEVPSVYTNVPAGSTTGVTILLFDTLNSRLASQAYALDRIRKVLHQIEPQDHLGIYVLGQDLEVAHGFTGDASDLVAAVQRYDASHSHTLNKGAGQATKSVSVLDHFLAGRDICICFPAFNSRMTTVSLASIARQLSAVPGRKELIWVTDRPGDFYSWPIRWPGLSSSERLDMERSIRLMNSAGIAVYPVAAKGVDMKVSTWGGVGMTRLASQTGGRAFFNRNDIETGIRRALNDSRFSYELTYYPQHNQWNGEWREKVNVNRPDVTVLARGGYFALPDQAPTPTSPIGPFVQVVIATVQDLGPSEQYQPPICVQRDDSHLEVFMRH